MEGCILDFDFFATHAPVTFKIQLQYGSLIIIISFSCRNKRDTHGKGIKREKQHGKPN